MVGRFCQQVQREALGVDLEIKKGGGVPSSRNSVSAGGLGGRCKPPSGSRAKPWWGPRERSPGSSPDLEL